LRMFETVCGSLGGLAAHTPFQTFATQLGNVLDQLEVYYLHAVSYALWWSSYRD
jgi:hypothetical protein